MASLRGSSISLPNCISCSKSWCSVRRTSPVCWARPHGMMKYKPCWTCWRKWGSRLRLPCAKSCNEEASQVRLSLPALLYFAQELEALQQEAITQLGEQAVGLIG